MLEFPKTQDTKPLVKDGKGNEIVNFIEQDLIGGRAVANALKFQVILDEDPNIC